MKRDFGRCRPNNRSILDQAGSCVRHGNAVPTKLLGLVLFKVGSATVSNLLASASECVIVDMFCNLIIVYRILQDY